MTGFSPMYGFFNTWGGMRKLLTVEDMWKLRRGSLGSFATEAPCHKITTHAPNAQTQRERTEKRGSRRMTDGEMRMNVLEVLTGLHPYQNRTAWETVV